MQAVILVGGEGTRLRPLTYGTPKPMVPLFGIPFLERTLGRLKEAGVDEVILAAGYLPRAIEDHLGDGSRVGIGITYVVEETPLGTAGAIKNVAQHLTGAFFVLNGDVLTSLDLRAMIAFHHEKGGLGVLHAIHVDDPSAFGCVVRDGNGRISSFVEKPHRDEAPTHEINAGTYLLERSVLDRIPAGRSVSIERDIFPQMLADGDALFSYVTNDYWLDVGRPQQYLQAHNDVLDRKLPLAPSGDRAASARGSLWLGAGADVPANVRPPAFVGAGARIDPAAVVGPYAVIGEDCTIGAGALVRHAVLWDRVHIETNARVTDAILASAVRVGDRAVVSSGAVVGHDATIASGTVLEPDARIVGATPAPST
ncbi:MAG: NDP-sugar synthase [Vulcanimicrobiaceae bacterium]